MLIRLSHSKAYVDYGTWPVPGGLNVLFLTDQELHVVQGLCFPRARDEDVVVTPVFPKLGLLPSDEERAEYDLVADSLAIQLTGGDTLRVAMLMPLVADELDEYIVSAGDTELQATNDYLVFADSHAGYLDIITGFHMRYVGSTATRLLMRATVSDNELYAGQVITPVSDYRYGFPCCLTLRDGDHLTCLVYGCSNGDDLYVAAWGIRLALP